MTSVQRWIAGILFLALFIGAIFAIGYRTGYKHVEAKWDADKLAFAEAQNQAIMERVENNQMLINKQLEERRQITKEYDEKLAIARAAIPSRLRVGKAICDRSTPAAASKDASSSDAADTGAGLLRADLDRDLRALMLKMEETAAIGRACQAGAIASGMYP